MIDFIFIATALVLLCFLLREMADPWAMFAWVVSRERVSAYIIKRAMRTPYFHLPEYMNRYWLFNPYSKVDGVEVTPIKWLPSVRVHHILRRDNDRHLHDHPWDARTVVLKGFYAEERLSERDHETLELVGGWKPEREAFLRLPGYTGPINHGEYHTITSVSDGGVWTLFITFGYKSTWGFLVDGKKVPWREYLDMNPDGPWSEQEKPKP